MKNAQGERGRTEPMRDWQERREWQAKVRGERKSEVAEGASIAEKWWEERKVKDNEIDNNAYSDRY